MNFFQNSSRKGEQSWTSGIHDLVSVCGEYTNSTHAKSKGSKRCRGVGFVKGCQLNSFP